MPAAMPPGKPDGNPMESKLPRVPKKNLQRQNSRMNVKASFICDCICGYIGCTPNWDLSQVLYSMLQLASTLRPGLLDYRAQRGLRTPIFYEERRQRSSVGPGRHWLHLVFMEKRSQMVLFGTEQFSSFTELFGLQPTSSPRCLQIPRRCRITRHTARLRMGPGHRDTRKPRAGLLPGTRVRHSSRTTTEPCRTSPALPIQSRGQRAGSGTCRKMDISNGRNHASLGMGIDLLKCLWSQKSGP